ncbi:MAG: cyclic nucleotide-binding domain-containing protein [Candidatus Schekmanbacteria bacterium]|nr:cyclic nucleotide-binding domain-containing protein [Candidatus Schekmanbacteria bacterium]
MVQTVAASLRLPPQGGARQPRNDHFILDEDLGFFAVADGLADPPRGAHASLLCLDQLHQGAQRLRHQLSRVDASAAADLRRQILAAIEIILSETNAHLLHSTHVAPWRRGTATSAAGVFCFEQSAYIAHAGTCRLFLVRGDRVRALNEPHTLHRHLAEQGRVSDTGRIQLMVASEVCAAFGLSPALRVDTAVVDLMDHDVLVIGSSNLTRYLGKSDFLAAAAVKDPDEAVTALAKKLEALGERPVFGTMSLVLVAIQPTPTAAPQERDWLETLERLETLFLFRELNEQERLRVGKIMNAESFRAGQAVFAAGDAADKLYIVIAGAVRVELRGVVLTTIGPGGHFGELALIDDAPRSAAVVAQEATTLLAIRRDDFLSLTRAESEIATRLLWALLEYGAGRVRELSDRLVQD